MSSEQPRERPRLNLKPRNEAAVAKAADERSKAAKSNPFGQAKPRESILAGRSGRKEEDILKEELSKDKLRLRLNAEQNGQRQAAETELQEIEEAISLEEDDSKKAGLQEELSKKQTELKDMLDGFEKLAIAKAKSGEGVRPSERRRLAEEREREQGGVSAGSYQQGAQAGSRGAYGDGDYNYGSPSAGNSFGNKNSRQGGYNSGNSNPGSSSQSSLGGGFRQGSGKTGYNEPLAQDYEKSVPGVGQGVGTHDMFANAPSGGPVASRGQDRF